MVCLIQILSAKTMETTRLRLIEEVGHSEVARFGLSCSTVACSFVAPTAVCSWKDGDAITALVDSMKPGICPMKEKTGDPVKDIDKAMHAANKGLDPPIAKT